MQDIIVYGVLVLLLLLTNILLTVDIANSDNYLQALPPSTTRIHIAALVRVHLLSICALQLLAQKQFCSYSH